MKKILLLPAFLLSFVCLFGQNTNESKRLKNTGILPEAVYTPSTEKYKESLANIDETLKRSEQKTQEQYYLESSFSIDDMMRSGIVLFNHEYNQYLEDIADILLADDPALRSKIHIYLLRSPVVNAFAAGEGNIFISMGLIAMLDNESQLAFVMGHEIGHIAKAHGIDFYMKASAIDRSGTDNRIMKNGTFNEKMIAKNMYSQKLEMEADDYGIDIILKTDYSTNSLNGVFDVLKYAYLPYQNISFPKTFFESEYYVISHNLMLDSVKSISGEPEIPDNDEALKSTHPSIGERREGLKKYLDSSAIDTKNLTLVSEDKFLKLRDIARYELPMFYLHNQYYQDAIYASYLGLQKDPANIYFEKIIAKSLTYLTKFRNSKEEDAFAENIKFDEMEGDQQQVYYMLQNMSNAELNVLALNYTYQTHLKDPTDKELMPLCKTLVSDLAAFHFDDDNDFIKRDSVSLDTLQAMADRNVTKIAIPKSTKATTSKKTTVKKAPYKQTSTAKKTDSSKSHLLYAFNNYWNNPEFQKMWDDVYEEKHETESTAEGRMMRTNAPRKMGVDKVVVMNPFYLRVDARKENAIEYISSEEGEIKYVDILKENAKLLNVELDIIDPLLMNDHDTERFNDMASLDDWFSEQLDFGSLHLPGHRQAEIDSIAKKYDTDYFLWTGILSLQDENNILAPVVYMLTSFLFPPLLPYGIYELFSPEYEFFYLAILFNVKSYDAQVIKYIFLESNDSRAILNSQTYDMLYQITAKPRY